MPYWPWPVRGEGDEMEYEHTFRMMCRELSPARCHIAWLRSDRLGPWRSCANPPLEALPTHLARAAAAFAANNFHRDLRPRRVWGACAHLLAGMLLPTRQGCRHLVQRDQSSIQYVNRHYSIVLDNKNAGQLSSERPGFYGPHSPS